MDPISPRLAITFASRPSVARGAGATAEFHTGKKVNTGQFSSQPRFYGFVTKMFDQRDSVE